MNQPVSKVETQWTLPGLRDISVKTREDGYVVASYRYVDFLDEEGDLGREESTSHARFGSEEAAYHYLRGLSQQYQINRLRRDLAKVNNELSKAELEIEKLSTFWGWICNLLSGVRRKRV